jgi:hypothetical protein
MKQGQKKLKEIGMEEEFAAWKKSVEDRPRGFQVGSKVRIKEGTTIYTYSGPGSIGVITCTDNYPVEETFEVRFEELRGGRPYSQERYPVWEIRKDALELIR